MSDVTDKDEALGREVILDHKARHAELHHALDELVADWMCHTGRRPSSATVLELMQWSKGQTENPT
jgi:hypothetical protein